MGFTNFLYAEGAETLRADLGYFPDFHTRRFADLSLTVQPRDVLPLHTGRFSNVYGINLYRTNIMTVRQFGPKCLDGEPF